MVPVQMLFSERKNLNLGYIVSFLCKKGNSAFNLRNQRQKEEMDEGKFSIVMYFWHDNQV